MHSVKKEENLIQYIYIYRGRLSKSFFFGKRPTFLDKKRFQSIKNYTLALRSG